MAMLALILLSMTSTMAVDLVVQRASTDSLATYHYQLRNQARESLHNFVIGTALSDSCPELKELPVGWSEEASCPSSIIVPEPWRGCVVFEEECEGHFLRFEYPEDGVGVGPGDSLSFSVTVKTEDDSHERASFWMVSDERRYVGHARKETAPANGRASEPK
jgi:hypothetical protein